MNKLESWKSLERNGEKPSEIAAFENAVSARRGKCRKYRTNPIRQTERRLKIQLNYFRKIIAINPHQHFQTTYRPTDKGTGSADYTHSAKLYPQPAGNFIHKALRESANRITPRAISIYSTKIDKR